MSSFRGSLYPYQVEGRDFALKHGYTINGFTMGLGKTATALAAMAEAESKSSLVVCPAFLRENWRREAEKFTRGLKLEVLSYEQMSKLGKLTHDFVVFDEAHYLKTPSAKRTLKAHMLVETCPPDYLMLLSGTPIKNRVPEIYSLLRLIWLGGNFPEFDGYGNSYLRFCRTFANSFAQRTPHGFVTKFEGVRNREQLLELIRPVYIRRRAEQVLDLPKQVYAEHVIAKSWKEDDALGKAWEAYNGGQRKLDFSSVKAVNALSKVPATVELVREILEQGKQVVVFSDHVKACQAIAEELDVPAITGMTPPDKRQSYVDAFTNGSLQVLCCTIGSMSTGINLTTARYMVMNDYPWVPADLQQAEKRIHRIGQMGTCFYYYVLASEVDAYILRTLKAKTKTIDEVVG